MRYKFPGEAWFRVRHFPPTILMPKLGLSKICVVVEILWVLVSRHAKIQSGCSRTFPVFHIVRKFPCEQFRKALETTEVYNSFGYRSSFTGWAFAHYWQNKYIACYRALWGQCWTATYWTQGMFLDGCNSKLHFLLCEVDFLTHTKLYAQA